MEYGYFTPTGGGGGYFTPGGGGGNDDSAAGCGCFIFFLCFYLLWDTIHDIKIAAIGALVIAVIVLVDLGKNK